MTAAIKTAEVAEIRVKLNSDLFHAYAVSCCHLKTSFLKTYNFQATQPKNETSGAKLCQAQCCLVFLG